MPSFVNNNISQPTKAPAEAEKNILPVFSQLPPGPFLYLLILTMIQRISAIEMAASAMPMVTGST